MKTIHDHVEELVGGALCGDLAENERSSFEAHLSECASCRNYYQEQQNMSVLIAASLKNEEPSAGFENRMVQAFRGRPQPWFLSLWTRVARSYSVQLTAVAAVLLALVQIGALVTHERENTAVQKGASTMATLKLPPSRTHPASVAADLPASGTVALSFGIANSYSGSTSFAAGTLQSQPAKNLEAPSFAATSRAAAGQLNVKTAPTQEKSTLADAGRRASPEISSALPVHIPQTPPAATTDASLMRDLGPLKQRALRTEPPTRRIVAGGIISSASRAQTNALSVDAAPASPSVRFRAGDKVKVADDFKGSLATDGISKAPAAQAQLQVFSSAGETAKARAPLPAIPPPQLQASHPTAVTNSAPSCAPAAFEAGRHVLSFLAWSFQMMGVAIVFLAPWAAATAAAIAFLAWTLHRFRIRKQRASSNR